MDLAGPRAVLVASVLVLSAAVASLALLTNSLWAFYAVFAGTSLFAAGASPLGYSAVLVRHLGLALGLALMGVGLGATIVPVVAPYLLSDFGWRGAYAGLGLLTLVITMPAVLVATRNLPAVRRHAGSPVSVSGSMATRAYITMCCIFALFGIVSVGGLSISCRL